MRKTARNWVLWAAVCAAFVMFAGCGGEDDSGDNTYEGSQNQGGNSGDNTYGDGQHTGGNQGQEPGSTCTVTFYPNPPEDVEDAENLAPQTRQFAVGSVQQLPEDIFTLDGYQLAGWADKDNVRYTLGDSFYFTADTDLYALWKAVDTTERADGLIIKDTVVVGFTENVSADLVIPDGVTAIGEDAFWHCYNITSLTIPDTVTTIKADAFGHCYNLASVTIPDSVTHIEDDAFNSCESLTTVTIPSNVQGIGIRAFAWCIKLETVIVQANITEIAFATFSGCDALKEVVLPDSVKTIGESAFSRCLSLESVTMNGVEYIHEKAFQESGLTSITLPASLKSIGDEAFCMCERLVKVVIPNSVTSIGTDAFSYCEELADVTLEEGLTVLGERIFYDCPKLEQIRLPSTLTSIPNQAFFVTGLTSVTIPDNITSIGENAFKHCNLTSVTVPENVTSIGEDAFLHNPFTDITILGSCGSNFSQGARFYITKNLRRIALSASCVENEKFWDMFSRDYSGIGYDEMINIDIVVLDGARYISENFFENGAGYFKSISLPDSLEEIKDGAFDSTKFDTITISDSVRSIGNSAFCFSAGLKKLPSNLEHIGRYAFAVSYLGESLTIPGSIRSFDEFAFYATSLKRVIIQPGLTEIPGGTFAAYSGNDPGNLEEVTIPNTVTTIGPSAFWHQTNLTDITIPDSVTCIRYEAFYGCSKLNATVSGAWYRVDSDDETKIVDDTPSGKNLYWYSNWNWYRK